MKLDIKPLYVEENCTFTHQGKDFTYGGSIALRCFDQDGNITREDLIGYPKFEHGEHVGAVGQLLSWKGDTCLGTVRITSKWRNKRGVISDYNFAFDLRTPDGITMKGRGMGDGMIAKFHKVYRKASA